jgi:hypothetical protein
MKQISVEHYQSVTLAELIELSDRGNSGVMITQGGEQRYLFLPHTPAPAPSSPPAEDDLGAEAAALARNPAFMAYLAECRARGEREGWVSLEDILREFSVPEAVQP